MSLPTNDYNLLASSPQQIFNTPIRNSINNTNNTNKIKTLPVEFYGRFKSSLAETINNNISNTPIGIVSNLSNLQNQLGVMREVSTFKSGSFNNVYKYNRIGITIRISKNPTDFSAEIDNGTCKVFIDHPERDIYEAEFRDGIQEIIKTKDNWLHANRLGICPEIYFSGYIIKPHPKNILNNYLYSVTVSKNYDYDLEQYYKEGPGRLLIKDKVNHPDLEYKNTLIAKQLINHLSLMAKEMKVICFDIKPLNAVINDSLDGTIDVRLIDWDADWCNSYSNILKKNKSDTGQTDNILTIINLYFANLFYHHIGCNIFYNEFIYGGLHGGYLVQKGIIDPTTGTLIYNERRGKRKRGGNIEALQHLWCNLTDPSGEKNYFHFMALAYLRDFHNCGSSKVVPSMNCEQTFDYVLKIATTPEKYNIPLIDHFNRTIPIPRFGGYKSKNKSRRVRKIKNKTKRKINKNSKKNRKTRCK